MARRAAGLDGALVAPPAYDLYEVEYATSEALLPDTTYTSPAVVRARPELPSRRLAHLDRYRSGAHPPT